MRQIAAKFVPRLLNIEQQDHPGSGVHQAAKSRYDPNFLSRVITGDKLWLYDYDPETTQQSSQWKTPSSLQLKKAR